MSERTPEELERLRTFGPLIDVVQQYVNEYGSAALTELGRVLQPYQPQWARVLGPWTRVTPGDAQSIGLSTSGDEDWWRSSVRYPWVAGCHVWRIDEHWFALPVCRELLEQGRPVSFATRDEAMRQGEVWAHEEGWLFDTALLNEDDETALDAEHVPTVPVARRPFQLNIGGPVVFQRHAWGPRATTLSGHWRETCSRCGRTRYRRPAQKSWRYFDTPQNTPEGWDTVGGGALAGQCEAPREAP